MRNNNLNTQPEFQLGEVNYVCRRGKTLLVLSVALIPV